MQRAKQQQNIGFELFSNLQYLWVCCVCLSGLPSTVEYFIILPTLHFLQRIFRESREAKEQAQAASKKKADNDFWTLKRKSVMRMRIGIKKVCGKAISMTATNSTNPVCVTFVPCCLKIRIT